MMKLEEFHNEENIVDILECNSLTNDTIFLKYEVSEGTKINIKDNQFVCLLEKGKVLDIKEKPGIYVVTEKKETDREEKIKTLLIRKTEKENLCIVFLNTGVIQNNKYYIKKPIEYIDWTFAEEPLVIKIKGEGKFDFQIVDPLSFLENMVIGLRTHYSKQELIEQIRNYIVNSIIKGITEVSNAYKINIQEICEKSKETDIGVSQNVYDDKLLEKGIKITFFNIEKLEANEESRYIATTEIKDEKMHICKNCGNVLEEDDTFCKICGALNISE